MPAPDDRDVRTEYETLLRALHQRLETERSFGLTHVPKPKKSRTAETPQQGISAKVTPTAPPAPAPPKEEVRKEPSPVPESPPSSEALSREEALAQLRKECEQCMRCQLAKTRTNPVFGSGSPNAELMFVGEAPGEEEDKQGEPFVGRAGQLLTKMIEAIDMKRSEVYICNILKSRPPGNRPPLPHEVAACLPFLKRQIRIIKPKIICALGATAAKTLLSTDKPIGQLRGNFFDYEGTKLIPTFHPSYLLRSPWEKAKAWEDLKKVRDTLKAMREGKTEP